MTPYHSDPWLTVWQGDCREVMAQMEPESVHCVVTSPPYWGLRDYGTVTWLGGDEGCDHAFVADAGATTIRKTQTYQQGHPHRNCRCGAIRQDSQLGLEPTPEEYVANMVAVFREVRRVLRADGTCWVNLGDSYQSNPGSGYANGDLGNLAGKNSAKYAETLKAGHATKNVPRVAGLKPKDLVGIPWRVAFALQADGWYLRSDIIWSKPNPMPESVTDRPTKAHEYLFLLSKSARYYYDADAVREAVQEWNTPTGKENAAGIESKRAVEREALGPMRGGRGYKVAYNNPAGRNLRSVWSIATQPYPGAHFATFPEALVEPCVKAGTSERGVCPECGAPWRRVVERTPMVIDRSERTHPMGRTRSSGTMLEPPTSETTGWRPTCDHKLAEPNLRKEPVPATVMDPFAGSGTTGRVAQRLGRRAVLIDLNGEYLTQTMKRNVDIPLGLEAG